MGTFKVNKCQKRGKPISPYCVAFAWHLFLLLKRKRKKSKLVKFSRERNKGGFAAYRGSRVRKLREKYMGDQGPLKRYRTVNKKLLF